MEEIKTESAPDWARFLAQDEDEVWYWHASKPKPSGATVSGEGYWLSTGESCIACRGHLLGDWRDTLERRPEPTRAEMEVELVKAAFKPLTSIEDNQEREMKQDNGWFERGDRPPLGRCLVKHKSATTEWAQPDFHEKNIVAAGDFLLIFRSDSGQETVGEWDDYEFRPIRTEREMAIEVMLKDSGALECDTVMSILENLLDKGWAKESK